MQIDRTLRFLLPAAVMLLPAGPAPGLINPGFTPVEMVHKADAIVVAKATPDADTGALTVKTVEVLKGEDPGITALDASDLLDDRDLAYRFEEFQTIPLVIVKADLAQAKADARSDAVAAVHLGTDWYGVVKSKEGYKLAADRLDLKAVWDGGHTPLVRAIRYVLSARRPTIRATSGVSWQEVRTIQPLPGRAGTPAVGCDGKGPTLLWPSSEGDWLLSVNARGNVKGQKLASRSATVTRADLDQDGKDEWIGTDGRRVYRITPDGTRELLRGLQGAFDLVPAGAGGKPAVLAVTPTGPRLIARKGRNVAAEPVLAGDVKGVRQARLLDVDGDRRVDLVMATDEQLLVAAGRSGGGFAEPAQVARLYDIDLRNMSAGDLDGDGAMDLLLTGTAEIGVILLAGDGKGGFSDVLEEGGELQYYGGGATASSGLCDVNNDGLVDLYLVPKRGVPKVMFNRGFRSFGLSRSLDLHAARIPGADAVASGGSGPRRISAATVLDINADAAPDILCVCDGKLLAILRRPRPSDLGATVRLQEGSAGPVCVTATENQRTLGSRLVGPDRPVFIGKSTKGPMELRCTWPGGDVVRKRLVVLAPTEIVLTPEQKD